jgi:hypothetical protein
MKGNEALTEKEFKDNIPVTTELTPMAMINQAVMNGADVDKLKALMDLQERWEKNEAKKAFDTAFLEFQKNPPNIYKTRGVSFKEGGPKAYSYAPLTEAAEIIRKALNPLGFTFRWEHEDKPEKVMRVTCVLTHEKGHSVSASMEGPHDPSGSKNGIQAVGSSDSYLKRYTLFSVTGMTAQDDDGETSEGKETVPDGVIADWITLMGNSATLDELKKSYTDAVKVANSINDKTALEQFIKAKDIRKAELSKKAT